MTVAENTYADRLAAVRAELGQVTSFLADAEAEIDAATDQEIRAGGLKKTGPTAKLLQKKAECETRLPELEREERALVKIVTELEAEAQAERNREIAAEGERISASQTEALAAFGEWFASGYGLWENYAETVKEMDGHWLSNRRVYGEIPPHVLASGPFPITFTSLLRLAAEALHRDWTYNGDRNVLNQFVPSSLPPDPKLELGGILERV